MHLRIPPQLCHACLRGGVTATTALLGSLICRLSTSSSVGDAALHSGAHALAYSISAAPHVLARWFHSQQRSACQLCSPQQRRLTPHTVLCAGCPPVRCPAARPRRLSSFSPSRKLILSASQAAWHQQHSPASHQLCAAAAVCKAPAEICAACSQHRAAPRQQQLGDAGRAHVLWGCGLPSPAGRPGRRQLAVAHQPA